MAHISRVTPEQLLKILESAGIDVPESVLLVGMVSKKLV
jgi:hypothetical protein